MARSGTMPAGTTPCCRSFLAMLCAQAHLLPPTLYLIKQIMDVIDISQIEWHSCERGCTGWRSNKKKWQDQKDDHCKKCGGKRFKTVMGRLQLVPVRVSSYATVGPALLSCSAFAQTSGALVRQLNQETGASLCVSVTQHPECACPCWCLPALLTHLEGAYTSTNCVSCVCVANYSCRGSGLSCLRTASGS